MGLLTELDLPLIAAPMAGGPTTPALVHAAAQAGGLGFLAGGYRTADDLADLIRTMHRSSVPFGVNLFVPQSSPPDAVLLRRYAERLATEASALDVDPPVPQITVDDDAWHAKLEVLLADPVPHVSVTFGLPAAYEISALQRAGSRVWATVTTPEEAGAAEALGVDGLMVQGGRAGGHSAVHRPHRAISLEPTADVVRAVRATSPLPIVAGGGVDGPETVREIVAAGATAVLVGTLLLRSDESGANATHRDALIDPRFTETIVTRAFTGRPARALRNGFIDRNQEAAPDGYPAVHHLTRAIRQAAAARGDADRLHLWAGTGHGRAATGPASAILEGLAHAL